MAPGNSTRSSITLGYLDSYSNYLTALSVEYSNKVKYWYERLGTKPEKIALPLKDSFLVTNRNIADYEVQHAKPFLRRKSLWKYRVPSGIHDWFITAPPGAPQVFPEMPAEILAKYPLLTPSIFLQNSSGFTVQGETYEDWIVSPLKAKRGVPVMRHALLKFTDVT